MHDIVIPAPGFDMDETRHIRELYRLVGQRDTQPGGPIIVILCASHEDNCLAASYLSRQHPGVGIVALLESHTEMALIELLRSGVDQYCLRTAAARMLGAIVSRLLHRLEPGRPDVAGAAVDLDPMTNGYWRLEEQGWTLIAPRGERLSLTTGERAFIGALLSASELRATHTELQEAVARSYFGVRDRHGTLGVLLTRLRRKLALHGLQLPIKSVHKWGYMFSGAVHIPRDTDSPAAKV